MTLLEIEEWFAYHSPSPEQVATMQRWRAICTDLASDFCQNSPSNPDQTLALRKLKDALMAMNATLTAPMPKNHR